MYIDVKHTLNQGRSRSRSTVVKRTIQQIQFLVLVDLDYRYMYV